MSWEKYENWQFLASEATEVNLISLRMGSAVPSILYCETICSCGWGEGEGGVWGEMGSIFEEEKKHK